MEAIQAYALTTASWLGLQAVPLFISPKLIITMLSPDARKPTDLETYFSRTLSLTLLTLALLSILLTGLLPLSSVTAESESESHPSAYEKPTTFITTTYHTLSLIYMYTTYTATGSICLALGMGGSGVLACWGVWCLMFVGEGGGRSRVSGWPFRNREERERKREKMMERKRKGKMGL